MDINNEIEMKYLEDEVSELREKNEKLTLANKALKEQLILSSVGICLEKKEKKLLTFLLAKDINNLSNIVDDNELLEGHKTDYRKLAKKISEA